MLRHAKKDGKVHVLPIFPSSVYAVSERGLFKANRHISDNFSGIIRYAVIYGRAQYSATKDQLTDFTGAPFQAAYELIKLSQRYKHHSAFACLISIISNDSMTTTVTKWAIMCSKPFRNSCPPLPEIATGSYVILYG